MVNPRTAVLLLKDGRFFCGKNFGAKGETTGEVCFNTGMSGYQEILTDPSYCKQIVTMTAPHIGNYGVNPDDIESDKINKPNRPLINNSINTYLLIIIIIIFYIY